MIPYNQLIELIDKIPSLWKFIGFRKDLLDNSLNKDNYKITKKK